MQLWKATAVKTYNDGKRKITPGMSVEFTIDGQSTPSSVWTGNSTRRKIAEAFVSKYNMSCTPAEFELVINNVNFEYKLM